MAMQKLRIMRSPKLLGMTAFRGQPRQLCDATATNGAGSINNCNNGDFGNFARSARKKAAERLIATVKFDAHQTQKTTDFEPWRDSKRGLAMPTDTAMIVAGIVVAFLVFAGTLAWGDMFTRGAHTPQPGE